MYSNISIKHHYLPEFYLKNFTNQENHFHIYLVEEKRFKKNGKLFPPSSHFFKPNANTTTFNGLTEDHLEKDSYTPLDNDIVGIFEKIKNSNEPKYGLSDRDVVYLDYFFAHLFWRNPSNDEFIRSEISRKNLQDFGFKIVNAKGETIQNAEANQIFKEHPDSYKLMKFWLPLALFQNKFKHKNNLHIIESPTKGLPAILGDNPVIVRGSNGFNTYSEDMVVPVTRDTIFTRIPVIADKFNPTTKLLIDLMQIRQAKEFVCCTDKSYIDHLNQVFETKIKDDETLKRLIFIGLVKN